MDEEIVPLPEPKRQVADIHAVVNREPYRGPAVS